MAKMILVEQYFYPDGWGGAEIPRDISIALRSAGIEIDVLCGTEQYAPMDPASTVQDPRTVGVNILRIPRLLPGSVRRGKMLRVLWFCFCALPVLLLRRRVDLIATQTNPPLIIPTIAAVAALRRIPFIIIAQDIYPDILFASGMTASGSWAGRALRRLFSWAYRRAHTVVALGPVMERRILAKGVNPKRIVTISNWATGEVRREHHDENPLRIEWGLQDRFVVLYSGNAGIGHEFDTFLDGLLRASALHPNLTAVFIGSGARLGEIRERVQALGIGDRVMFRDFVPAELLPQSMGLADLALVTLRSGFEGIMVPSKLLGYMARGIPTLYIGPDSDISALVRAADCGTCCAPGQADSVAEVLGRVARDHSQLRRWSQGGMEFYAAHLTRERALNRYIDLARTAMRMAAAGE
jgi:glycosyltransferase involved in cell wall biosynthesis